MDNQSCHLTTLYQICHCLIGKVSDINNIVRQLQNEDYLQMIKKGRKLIGEGNQTLPIFISVCPS